MAGGIIRKDEVTITIQPLTTLGELKRALEGIPDTSKITFQYYAGDMRDSATLTLKITPGP